MVTYYYNKFDILEFGLKSPIPYSNVMSVSFVARIFGDKIFIFIHNGTMHK